MGIGDWGLGIGAQSPIPNPQSPIPNPHFFKITQLNVLNNLIKFNKTNFYYFLFNKIIKFFFMEHS